jgi:hypothetical protein
MKAVLADPEWWDDPDKKAHDVAMGCVRDFEKSRNEEKGRR